MARPAARGLECRLPPLLPGHAPTPKPPKGADPQALAAFKEARKKHRLSLVALEQLRYCRQELDGQPGGSRRWLMDVVDGGYANRTFLGGLPERTDVVARVRKDATFRVWLPPAERRGARKYGPNQPTPLAALRDPSLGWQSCQVFVAGQIRPLEYKEVTGLCWPKVTQTRPLRLLLIKAPGYRLRKGGKLLYREPAFLITTDMTTPAAELIVAYLARWEVEVNFRDEKTLLGVGQAQVRQPQAVVRAPAFLVACYSMLVEQHRRLRRPALDAFPTLPAWRKTQPARPSTRDLIRLLRRQAADAYVNPMRD